MPPAHTTAIESPREQQYLSTIEIPTSNAPWTPGRLYSCNLVLEYLATVRPLIHDSRIIPGINTYLSTYRYRTRVQVPP